MRTEKKTIEQTEDQDLLLFSKQKSVRVLDPRSQQNQHAQLYPAYNDSLVRVQWNKVDHLSGQGSIINSIKLTESAMGGIHMITDRDVIVFCVTYQSQNTHIVHWNLEHNKVQRWNHKFQLKGNQCSIDFHIFPTTKLMCIVETQLGNRYPFPGMKQEPKQKKRIRILYLHYPTDSKPISVAYEYNFEIKTTNNLIAPIKINHESGIYWNQVAPPISPSLKNSIVHIFDLNTKVLSMYTFEHFFNPDPIFFICVIQPRNVQEPLPGKLYLKFQVMVSSRNSQAKIGKDKKVLYALHKQEKKVQLLWNYKEDKQPRIVQYKGQQPRILQFTSGLRPQLRYQIQHNSYDRFDPPVKPSHSQFKQQPIYYMDAVSENIVTIQPASTNFILYMNQTDHILYFPLYNTNMYISYAPMPLEKGTIFTYTTYNWIWSQAPILYAWMLMQIYQDWDQDILRITVQNIDINVTDMQGYLLKKWHTVTQLYDF